jgi:hypothetical protein
MAKCIYCGDETQLYVSGTPVCLDCETVTGRKLKEMARSGDRLPEGGKKSQAN